MKKSLLLYALILSLFFIVSCKDNKKGLPYYDTADFTPKWEMANEKTFHQIRPFSLINQENQAHQNKTKNVGINTNVFCLHFVDKNLIYSVLYVKYNSMN